jgi:glyoxylase-like metal-dependent hydrolase (beta-lactamase superfamily II)
MRLIDVKHLGRERVIGSWLVDGCLIDPGPSSAFDGLLEGLGDDVVERVLLTHIHLDHAGATGKVIERFPDAEVWVHEKGAPHVADPTKLVRSATRIYGDDMERLWGEIVPVPRDHLRVLGSGDEERIGDWRIAYTPGHASHHVSFLHEPTRTAFTGDVAGVRIGDGPVLPPTPPPDIDLEAWPRSLDIVSAWAPDRLAVTHFGAYDDVDEHLGAMRSMLTTVTEWARELDEDAYAERIRAYVAERADADTAAAYEQGMPAGTLHPGLARALGGVASSSG